MLAIERFETILDVYNHDAPNKDNPVPLSRHNEFSQTAKESVAARQIKSLLQYKVPQKTNMSLVELLSLNTEAFRIIVTQCKLIETNTMRDKDALNQLFD